jgi:sodium/proline symporter
MGLGLLFETLFGLPYLLGITLGLLLIVPYLFVGGYVTLAWIDLFQGLFLMGVILFVPLYVLPQIGGMHAVAEGLSLHKLTTSLLPDLSLSTWLGILFTFFGWGLGYFGQPHIVTKFMGIRAVSEIPKSKYIGISWMCVSLGAATLVGLVGIPFFEGRLHDPQQVFIQMVSHLFHPFVIGLMLCAVLAATVNAISSQVLVLSSSLSEDLYKRWVRPHASSAELLLVSRIGVLAAGAIAFAIAWGKWSSIFSLVLYAWSGLGASFGPLLILTLYSRKVHYRGAWAGLLAGGVTAALWPYINSFFTLQIPSMIVGYAAGSAAIVLVSAYCRLERRDSIG